jgi:tetratricopeptide (TPR) repeat protein
MTANAQRTTVSGAEHVQLLSQAEQAWRAGRPAEALELCRKCEEAGAALPDIYGMQGDIYTQLGNLPIASSFYERAIAMDTTNVSYVLKAGQVALIRQESPQSFGRESAEFLVAGHAGSTPRALGKVASGWADEARRDWGTGVGVHARGSAVARLGT